MGNVIYSVLICLLIQQTLKCRWAGQSPSIISARANILSEAIFTCQGQRPGLRLENGTHPRTKSGFDARNVSAKPNIVCNPPLLRLLLSLPGWWGTEPWLSGYRVDCNLQSLVSELVWKWLNSCVANFRQMSPWHYYNWYLWIKQILFFCIMQIALLLSQFFICFPSDIVFKPLVFTWGIFDCLSTRVFISSSVYTGDIICLWASLMVPWRWCSHSEPLQSLVGRVCLHLCRAVSHMFTRVWEMHGWMERCAMSYSIPGCPVSFLRAGTVASYLVLSDPGRNELLNNTYPFPVFTSAAVLQSG